MQAELTQLQNLKTQAQALLEERNDASAYWHYQQLIEHLKGTIAASQRPTPNLKSIRSYSIKLLQDNPDASAYWHYTQVIDKINRVITYIQKTIS